MVNLKKRKNKKNKLYGFSILLGSFFTVAGFLGSFAASFLWELQKNKGPELLYFVGFLYLIAFFVIIIYITKLGNELF